MTLIDRVEIRRVLSGRAREAGTPAVRPYRTQCTVFADYACVRRRALRGRGEAPPAPQTAAPASRPEPQRWTRQSVEKGLRPGCLGRIRGTGGDAGDAGGRISDGRARAVICLPCCDSSRATADWWIRLKLNGPRIRVTKSRHGEGMLPRTAEEAHTRSQSVPSTKVRQRRAAACRPRSNRRPAAGLSRFRGTLPGPELHATQAGRRFQAAARAKIGAAA